MKCTARLPETAAGETNVLTNNSTNLTESSSLLYEPISVLEVGRSPSPIGDQNFPVTGLPFLPDCSLPQFGDIKIECDGPEDEWSNMFVDFNYSHDSPLGGQIISQFVDPNSHFDFASDSSIILADYPPLDLYAPPKVANAGEPDVYRGGDEVSWTVGFDAVNELIRAAEYFELNEIQVAQTILSRLEQRMQSPTGKPLHRAAFYFKESLRSLIKNRYQERGRVSSSPADVIQMIRTYRAFSSISPIPLFSHFTANQALLEVMDGSAFTHIIDFDIGLGGKWASFMKEVADRAHQCRKTPPVILISAVVPEDFAAESRLIGDSLSQFANEVNIGFHISFVPARSFAALSFKAIKFAEGERTAVYLSPTTFARFCKDAGGTIGGFLLDLRRISPYVVVFVDDDKCDEVGPSAFSRNFVRSLNYYSTIMESLDAAGDGSGGEWVRMIEAMILKPKIFAAIEAAAVLQTANAVSWKESFAAAGLRVVRLSQFAESQAQGLLGKSDSNAFHVAKRNGEMVLCWHERTLIATSAWKS